MFSGISTGDFVFPTGNRRDYNAALQAYNQVKPKRTDGKRPLKKQRAGPYYIDKRADGAIQFIYHRTTVVTIHPNDTIEYDLSWHSRSTMDFANHFSWPTSVHYAQNRAWVHTREDGDSKWYCTGHAVFDLETSQMLSGQTRLEAMRVDRAKSTPILTRLRPVIAFLNAAVQLDPNYVMRLRVGNYTWERSSMRFDKHTLDQIDLTNPDSFVDNLFIPLTVQNYAINTHTALIAHIKRTYYKAYDAYGWVLLPDGSSPPTTDWRVVK